MAAPNPLNNVEDLYPLTPMQQLMLLHSATSVGGDRLVNQLVYTVDGEVDREAFRAAWERVVSRHPALRTAFVWEGLPEPLQAVRESVAVPVEFVECGAEPGAFEALAAEDQRRGFRLMKAPLVRATLVETPGEAARLLWTCHSLVADRWCFQPLLEEWLAAYDALVAGETAGAAVGAGAFGDYLSWIDEQDQGEAASYWRRHLDGYRGSTLISRFGQRDGGASEGHVARRSLDAADTAALRGVARTAGITLGTVVQGATALALAGFEGREQPVFGLSVPGRPVGLEGADETVGSFINNVPVRVRVAGERPLKGWLKTLQAEQATRARYEYASSADICRWAELPAAASLYDVFLVYAPHDVKPSQGRSLTLRLRSVGTALGASARVLLAIGELGDELAIDLYSTNALLGAEHAERLVTAVAETLRRFANGLSGKTGDFLPETARLGGGLDGERTEARRSSSARTPQARKPRTNLETQLMLARQQVLGIPNRDLEADFFAIGGNSLSAARFLERVERLTGRELGLGAILQNRTIDALAKHLESESAAVQNPFLVQFREGSERPPVFFYEAEPAMHLAEHMLPGRAVYGMITRQAIAMPIEGGSLEAIASEYAEQIRGTCPPSEQIVVGGYCYGGALALEIARQLAESGFRPPIVLSLATRYSIPLRRYVPYLLRRLIPQWIRRFSRWPDRSVRRKFAYSLRTQLVSRLVRALPASNAVKKLMPERKSAGEAAAGQTAEVMAAVFRHQPKPYGGPVVAVLGSNMSDDPRDPHMLSLREAVLGKLDVVVAPFYHERLIQPVSAEFLAETVEEYATTHDPAAAAPDERAEAVEAH